MIYLDTDFVINYLLVQNKESNRIAEKRFEILKEKNQIFISLLTLQEVSFVLGKLSAYFGDTDPSIRFKLTP